MTSWIPPALMNHLWQSTLFVIVVWLVTLALRRNTARVRCWLWLSASAKFLMPVSMLVSLGEQFQWRAAPAAMQPAVAFVMNDVLAPAAFVSAAPASMPQSSLVWPLLLLGVWCAGAVGVLAMWWRHWLPVRAALRIATPLRLDAEYGTAGLAVLSSASTTEPGVVGIWRPRLLLPGGIDDRLTRTQLRALIAHERCHVRCHDNLAAAFHLAVEALFWFHPAVWWIERRLVDERERACDEAVIRAGYRPQDYAEGILAVCRQSVEARLGCVAGVAGSNLRARVEAIMRNEIGRPMTGGRRWAVATSIVAIVVGPVAGGALIGQSQAVVPPATLAFETASISRSALFDGRPVPVGSLEASAVRAMIARVQDGQFRTQGSLLHQLIEAAYDVRSLQVEGGPEWVRTDRYAIEARANASVTPDELRGMLQSLLADRFRLSLRRERRILPAYELVAADGGLKIAAMKPGDCIPPKEVRWDLIDLEAPLFICGGGRRGVLSQWPETRVRPRWPRVTRLEMGGISMSSLIDFISGDVDRVIIDKTGFTDRFNLLLDFASADDARLGPSSGPTIFTALEEQLGLRLKDVAAPVDVLVIENVEPPALN